MMHETQAPRSNYVVRTFRHVNALPALESDWDRVSASAAQPNPFASFDWYSAWLNEQANTLASQPFVLTFEAEGTVRGVAPLTRAETTQAGLRFRRLQFAAREHEWDYNDLLVGVDHDQAGMLDALARHLSERQDDWELVDLMDVRDRDGEPQRIRRAMMQAGLDCAILPVSERCPYMPITGSWEQLLSQRSSATRHSLRNRQSKLRRLAGDGLRMRVLDAPQDEPGLLARMIELEAQKRSGGELSVPFMGRHAEVFDHVLRTMGPKGWLCVGLLEWNERLLSWHLLFRAGSALWGYLTVYDHELARLSPGTMLMPAIVDYGFSHGYREYDFLSGEETYKLPWAAGFHQRARILVWNRRWKSRLYAAAYRRRHAQPPPAKATPNSSEGTTSA